VGPETTGNRKNRKKRGARERQGTSKEGRIGTIKSALRLTQKRKELNTSGKERGTKNLMKSGEGEGKTEDYREGSVHPR